MQDIKALIYLETMNLLLVMSSYFRVTSLHQVEMFLCVTLDPFLSHESHMMHLVRLETYAIIADGQWSHQCVWKRGTG